MVTKQTLLAGGYTPAELNEAGTIAPGTPWHERPDLRQVDGVLQYCNYRCLNSEYGGGNCRCINHPPEEWMVVTD